MTKEMNSIQTLRKIEEEFTKKYKPITLDIDDNQYFLMNNGTVFQVLYFPPFDCYTVSYANSIEEANCNFFEEGDQFDASQSFASLMSEIEAELELEEAV